MFKFSRVSIFAVQILVFICSVHFSYKATLTGLLAVAGYSNSYSAVKGNVQAFEIPLVWKWSQISGGERKFLQNFKSEGTFVGYLAYSGKWRYRCATLHSKFGMFCCMTCVICLLPENRHIRNVQVICNNNSRSRSMVVNLLNNVDENKTF